ncbi:spore coat protein [Fonticella tunisiensis]|uniref:Coat F domain-containing protein n=1 Tax=Fonticella tunisiensis TaxID=1096341 RepID=A0A4R7KCB5_9CLOT|nr:spore coat protein [Fonticella tunisiensis]TDT50316.1 coat F domain-containing protein [Fonticella tunisiensis]
MSGYNNTTNILEKDRMNDILATQKYLSDLYNTGANEADCSSLHNELLNILREEHEIEHRLYDAMKKRGWYDASKADMNEVNKVYNEYNSMKADLGIK